ncbi:MAG: hypothetical protein QM610_15970 [Chitinophagaceae bacterium]
MEVVVKHLYEEKDGLRLVSDNKSMDGEYRLHPDFTRKWRQLAAIYEIRAVIDFV